MPGGVVVEYPAIVKRYALTIDRNEAKIGLEGFEKGALFAESEIRRIGTIVFRDPLRSQQDFITRGGWLLMERPLTMLSAVLGLLGSAETAFINEAGELSTEFGLKASEDEA